MDIKFAQSKMMGRIGICNVGRETSLKEQSLNCKLWRRHRETLSLFFRKTVMTIYILSLLKKTEAVESHNHLSPEGTQQFLKINGIQNLKTDVGSKSVFFFFLHEKIPTCHSSRTEKKIIHAPIMQAKLIVLYPIQLDVQSNFKNN